MDGAPGRPTQRVLTFLAFGVVPVFLVVLFIAATWHRGTFLFDFRGDLYDAGQMVWHGDNPYDPAALAREAALKRAGAEVTTVFAMPVYPAPALVAAVPFAALPYRAAGLLFVLSSVAAIVTALRLLEVRDRRCYGATFLCWPVLHGLMLGALTPLLMLGVAAVWRWRNRVWPPAVALALIVIAKLFLWPLVVWAVLTRRYRVSGLAAVTALALVLAGWAVIGFTGLAQYPRMLNDLSYVEESVGVSPIRGLLALGVPRFTATLLAVACACGLLGAAWVRGRGNRERRTFGMAVIAALVASPIVWPHYLALLFVPIALLSRSLSLLWFAPLLAYVAPVAQTSGHAWRAVPYYVIVAIVAFRTFDLRAGLTRRWSSTTERAADTANAASR